MMGQSVFAGCESSPFSYISTVIVQLYSTNGLLSTLSRSLIHLFHEIVRPPDDSNEVRIPISPTEANTKLVDDLCRWLPTA